MRVRGLAEATAVVLAGVALTAVLTYPLAFQIDRVGRVNTDDGRWSIWVVSWVAHALTSDPAGVYQANIFYPQRNALAFSEANLVEGAIGAPVWALTRNPYTTHNAVALASFVIAFAGAYYLVRHLTGSRGGAAVAAVLYAFSPFTFARTAHIQLLFTGGIPFCLLAFHHLKDRPTVLRALTLGRRMPVGVRSIASASRPLPSRLSTATRPLGGCTDSELQRARRSASWDPTIEKIGHFWRFAVTSRRAACPSRRSTQKTSTREPTWKRTWATRRSSSF